MVFLNNYPFFSKLNFLNSTGELKKRKNIYLEYYDFMYFKEKLYLAIQRLLTLLIPSYLQHFT